MTCLIIIASAVLEPATIQPEKQIIQSYDVRKAKTMSRLQNKSNPYDKQTLEEISLQSYDSIHITELCEEWTMDNEVIENLSDEV